MTEITPGGWMPIPEARKQVEVFKQELEESKTSLKEYEYLLFRISSLTRRMGLPERADKVIMTIQQMALTVRVLEAALIALESGTTYGAIKGFLLLIGGGLTVGAVMDMERPQY